MVVQGVPENVDLFRILLEFSDNLSETFTYSFSFGTYNVYMHLSLSFVRFAELLPLILNISFSSFFKIFNSCYIINWSSKTAISLL